MSNAPTLEGDARAAVGYRDGHVQIIAAAGSGKTEVVSQRVATLLAEGTPPSSIVAFTFTERAANELRDRIEQRTAALMGPAILDRFGGLFVGTIHAYCFRLLQQHVSTYETYDVLDENQLTAFLSREERRLDLRPLDPEGRDRMFAAIEAFTRSVDVVENELLDPALVPDPLGTRLRAYLDTLERYRLLTYGQQIVRAVGELRRPEVAARVHAQLRHLVVDEYQDINPAQEALIRLLAGPGVQVCVVGDDDQAIYQWRGSNVANIVTFRDRYPDVRTFSIVTNRRSRPGIIAAANRVSATIPGRLPKEMRTHRAGNGGADVVAWRADDEHQEAEEIARLIRGLHHEGLPYRDIAVLARSRSAYPRLLDAFASAGIPVQPGGRTGLFDQPEALVLGKTIAWLSGFEWRQTYRESVEVTDDSLLDDFRVTFGLDAPRVHALREHLAGWKALVPRDDRTADLIRELYDLLAVLEVRSWPLDDPLTVNRLGTLARFSTLLADYESVRRRARPDAEREGEQVGGQDRGEWYYRGLAIHLVNYASGAYEAFDGEPDVQLDAVDLTTVHSAKGLEWPVVFVPSLTAGRFPSPFTGKQAHWLLPRTMFNAARYEGGDEDERRLFYVALTRARDWASLSRHDVVTKAHTAPSPYWQELADHAVEVLALAAPSGIEPSAAASDAPITITYSELAAFLECGQAYRLRNLIGFQPRLAPELGYGKAVHHVLRTVAERTRAGGRVPSETELGQLLDRDFFLPAANKPAHRNLKEAARRLVTTYATNHADDLLRVWETERPFELHLDGITVTGRADVILEHEGGVPTGLAILDYKTSVHGEVDGLALQLQVYADAGRREGLDVRGAYVHDLKAADRTPIDVSERAMQRAESVVVEAATRIRAKAYVPAPGPRCRGCEVRSICSARAE